MIGDAIQDDPEEIFMEDVDGSGFSLSIPALLIDSYSHELILESLFAGNVPTLKANIEISYDDEKVVDVGLWYGSNLDLPGKLIK